MHSQLSEVLHRCLPCKKTFKTPEQLEQHRKSKNHKKAEKVYLEAHPEAAASSLFDNITTDKPLMGSVLSILQSHNASQQDEEEDQLKAKALTDLIEWIKKEPQHTKQFVIHFYIIRSSLSLLKL